MMWEEGCRDYGYPRTATKLHLGSLTAARQRPFKW